jgi:hypothetical protein
VRGIQLSKYFFKHSICLLQYFIIPEANNPIPFRLKKSCSIGIACRLFRMLPAIQLNNQLLFETDEINDVWWNRVLPPKLESAEVAVLQLQPQPQFRVG